MEKIKTFFIAFFAFLFCITGQAKEVSVTFDPTTDHATKEQPYSITKDGITCSVEVITSGITSTETCLTSGKNYKFYSNMHFTISSTKGRITEIVFTSIAKTNDTYGPSNMHPEDNSLKKSYHVSHNKGMFEYANGLDSIVFRSESEVIVKSITVTYDDNLAVNGPAIINLDGSSTETNNDLVIQNAYNTTRDVNLQREFSNDGGWYTLCLPFSLTQDELKAAFGDKVEIDEFSSVKKNGEQYNLEFTSVNGNTTAGCPYLIKPSKTSDKVITFKDVTISNIVPITIEKDGIQFIGTYNATTIPIDNKTCFLSGKDGLSLVFSNNASDKLEGTRAYFVLNNTTSNAKVMIHEDSVTGINDINIDKDSQADYFTLSGVRLHSMPLHSGIYIYQGKKIIIR